MAHSEDDGIGFKEKVKTSVDKLLACEIDSRQKNLELTLRYSVLAISMGSWKRILKGLARTCSIFWANVFVFLSIGA